jgi:hypothetical protein
VKFVGEARALGNEVSFMGIGARMYYTTIRQLHQPADGLFEAIVEFIRRHEK